MRDAAKWSVPTNQDLSDHVWTSGIDDVRGDASERFAGEESLALVEESTSRTWTRSALRALVDVVAAHLVDTGLRPGDVVLLGCANGHEMIAAYYGILSAGGTVLLLDPSGTEREWAGAVDGIMGRHAVLDGPMWRKLRSLAIAKSLVDVVTVEAGAPDNTTIDARHTTWDALVHSGASTPRVMVLAAGEQTAVLISSSGTEGRPKRVLLTHRNLVANLAQIRMLHRLKATDVVLGVTPFRHIYGMQMAMNAALRAGSTLVVASSPFSAQNFVDLVQRYRITVAYLVPSIIANLVRLPDLGGHDLSSLRMIFSGGAPLSAALADECATRLGVAVVQGYGMTEAGCACITPDENSGPAGSVGVPLPGTQIRILDPDTGSDLPAGQEGEIALKGPQISPGYLDDPGASAALRDAEGWVHTGDLARQAADGYITITGRRKQLIKYKGYQVAPAELEAVLLTHPLVCDAAVIGVPDEVVGEIPKAYVVLREPVPLDALLAYVATRVSPYKKIRLIEALLVLPRSSTGKVIMDALPTTAASNAGSRRSLRQ